MRAAAPITAAQAVPRALLGGLVASLLVLAANPGNVGAMILAALAPLPLFMVGLGVGNLALAVAVVAGLAATGAVGGQVYGVGFVLLAALPVTVLVPLALAPPAPPPPGRLALGLAILGCAVLGLAIGLAASEPGGLESLVREQLAARLHELERQGRPLPPGMSIDALASAFAFRIPGTALASWLVIVAANGALAQGVLARFEWNLRPTPAMAALTLPRLTSVAFVAAVAAAEHGVGEVAFIGANLAQILAVPLTLGGLAVVHMAVRHHPARLGILIGVYVVTILVGLCAMAYLALWPVLVIVAPGVVEQWVGLRRRLAAATSRGEK